MKICFELNGAEYCINIDQFVPIIIEDPNPPDPLEPWLISPVISREAVADLAVLAGVHKLVKFLRTANLQEQLTQTLRDSVVHLDLPQELNTQFD
jgi:hypothetical protein